MSRNEIGPRDEDEDEVLDEAVDFLDDDGDADFDWARDDEEADDDDFDTDDE